MFPFSSSSLVPRCLICVRRRLLSRLRGDSEVCSYAELLWKMAFLKSSIKKASCLETHLSLQVLPLAHVFPLWLRLLLISSLLSWGSVPAVVVLTAADS